MRKFKVSMPKPFRDLRGRFAAKKKFRVFLREIRVVPVEIEAANEADAKSLVMEGDGDYKNADSIHSDLDASEYFDLFSEKAPEIIP